VKLGLSHKQKNILDRRLLIIGVLRGIFKPERGSDRRLGIIA
jgi:hypothetical protein